MIGRLVPSSWSTSPAMMPLWLTHLNPLFASLNPFPVLLANQELRLMVPVAKDGQIPPGQPAAR
jgi:hypothetical protein